MNTKCLFLCVSTCLFASSFTTNPHDLGNIEKADQTGFSDFDDSFKTTYNVGDTLNVPPLTYQGEKVENVSLLFPSGISKRGTQILLDEPGIYTLKYFTEDYQTKEVKITVNQRAFSLSSTKSKAYYYTVPNDVTYTYPADVYKTIASRDPNSGLRVDLYKGDRITFNSLIDVHDFTGKAFLEGFVLPANAGTADFNSLDVILEDSLDPNIYLTFNLARHQDTNRYTTVTSVKVAGQNQVLTGFESGKNIYHVNDSWGTSISHSFTDLGIDSKTIVAPNRYQFILGYNHETKVCYAGENDSTTGRDSNNLRYVADLDSLEAFENLWQGFPSGKCTISFQGNGYSGNSASFVITYLMNMPDLTAEVLKDSTNPTITLEEGIEGDYLPEGYLNQYYTIPSASALDDTYGNQEVKVSVDFNYLSGHPIDIPIVDHTFLTCYEGYYRIKYEASDPFENKATKILYVHVGNPIEPLKATLKDSDTVLIGQEYTLPEPLITGGSGKKSIEITLKDSENHTLSLDHQKSYVFKNEGDYQLLYTIRDFAGASLKKAIAIKANRNPNTIIPTLPTFPQYFLNGAKYTIPALKAYDYSSGKETEIDCRIQVKNSKGETTEISGGSEYTPLVEHNYDKITFTYLANSTTSSPIEVPVILIENDGFLNLENYFTGAENHLEMGRNGAKIVGSKEESDVSWTFANRLIADGCSVMISSLGEKKSLLGSMEFTFTDSADSTISVTATMTYDNSNLYFKVGDFTYSVPSSFNGNTPTVFTLSYDDGAILYLARNGQRASRMPIRYLDNTAFSSFPSNFVYLTVRSTEMQEDNGYYVVQVNGNSISSYITSDTTAPKVYTSQTIGRMLGQGSRYKIGTAFASDTFAPNSSLTMTVTSPSGNIVSSTDGIKLDAVNPNREYEFELTELGYYMVSYTAKEIDWPFTTAQTTTYVLECVDILAPTIQLDWKMQEEAKVGDSLYLPTLKVTDDITQAENIKVFCSVITPNQRQIVLSPGQGIKATETGYYSFVISALDEAGNQAFMTLKVLVK